MTIKSKDLNGTYKAIALYETDNFICGVKAIAENADKIADAIKIEVEAQGCKDFKREGNTVYFGNQFVNLPKLPEKREGTITFRSKDYFFSCPAWNGNRPSYGDKPKKDMLTDNGFLFESSQGCIRYVLLEKV